MELLEEAAHSFIIRLWLEERDEASRQATWRGLITHVPTNKRAYVSTLAEIHAFIAAYLREMGVEAASVE